MARGQGWGIQLCRQRSNTLIYVANLCLDVNLLKVMLVFGFVFFPIVVVTVHGEVRAEHGLCRLLGPLSAKVMDSVLKNSIQIRVASLLVFAYGELLPFQAFPLLKHHPSCAICGQVEGQCSGKELEYLVFPRRDRLSRG